MRRARGKAIADARVASRRSGLTDKHERQKFIDYARSGISRASFKESVGLLPKLDAEGEADGAIEHDA